MACYDAFSNSLWNSCTRSLSLFPLFFYCHLFPSPSLFSLPFSHSLSSPSLSLPALHLGDISRPGLPGARCSSACEEWDPAWEAACVWSHPCSSGAGKGPWDRTRGRRPGRSFAMRPRRRGRGTNDIIVIELWLPLLTILSFLYKNFDCGSLGANNKCSWVKIFRPVYQMTRTSVRNYLQVLYCSIALRCTLPCIFPILTRKFEFDVLLLQMDCICSDQDRLEVIMTPRYFPFFYKKGRIWDTDLAWGWYGDILWNKCVRAHTNYCALCMENWQLSQSWWLISLPYMEYICSFA